MEGSGAMAKCFRGRSGLSLQFSLAVLVLAVAAPAARSQEVFEEQVLKHARPTAQVETPGPFMAFDNWGNLYVAGGGEGPMWQDDYTTIKYDPNGVVLWLARYDGPANSSDDVYALAVDNLGNVSFTKRG